MGLLILLVLFSPLAIDIYLPALPMIAQSFHVEHALAQDTITWFLFAMGVGQLFSGPLADKLGRRTVALGGIGIYALSALLAWSAQNIEWMLMARLLQGLGACATSVAAFATVRDLFGPERSGKMISYLNGAICFIPALAPILGSWLTQQFGWRANFSFMAGFAVTVGLLMLLCMQETNPSTEKQAVFKLSRYWAVLKTPSFLFHASLCLFAMAVILAYVTSAPLVLMERLGLTMNQFTFWFGLNALVNIVACLSAPRVMEKVGTHRILVLGIITLIISGTLMIVLAHIQTAFAFMVPIFLSSVGFAWILGAAAGKALAPFGDKAGTAAALLGLFQMSGSGLLVGSLQRFNLEPQMLIALHMWLLAPGLIILFSKAGRRWHQWALHSS
ncbi:Bcr/CflA family efflux MFS transporter [Vibrio sp. V27_P1S3P104]|uniref:multidrug effflux MFS transporter n=1 Tax=unclassified Vibrio TaxID=2614977 RepID=UPI001372EBE3|nr:MULTISPECIES: multidrug effflux MFS transporter [unclassified Vibrio]NAW69129.1 Bcr/CflA family efflux MFS transporter [Vibrio sp. V28_P6S34P95]NAX03894.1 Bcr/CflA family efflux MFS transporter [Vibrio sp. V30_P3S12P165]NAX33705.1 Bcr/CflA family efflux MFS transporter [Vibrio sp. V29_P1S30P107]NAX36736.1 Bcr/CflA family efflux MFS transporter [Vibrio sp. V27_P1S3P104]NAX40244.1 Bcr/CflA family efflux MFS transporter [Vibrio sp. V26_P1S5P106]